MIVTRNKYKATRRRTVVYFPTEYPKDSNGQSVLIPPQGFSSGPTRKLWAYRMEFDNYDKYIAYLKSERYLKGTTNESK